MTKLFVSTVYHYLEILLEIHSQLCFEEKRQNFLKFGEKGVKASRKLIYPQYYKFVQFITSVLERFINSRLHFSPFLVHENEEKKDALVRLFVQRVRKIALHLPPEKFYMRGVI